MAAAPAPSSPGSDLAPQRVRDLSRSDWVRVLRAAAVEFRDDQVPLLAAGVAFYALVALVPALVAAVSLYGLVADPAAVGEQVGVALAAAPDAVRELVATQLEAVTSSDSSRTGLSLAAGLAAALWAASAGVKHLIAAVNLAWDLTDRRGFLRVRALALAFTAGAVSFLVAAVAALAAAPALAARVGVGPAGQLAVSVLRWPALAAAFALGLAVTYRFAPDRDGRRWRWLTPGAALGTLLWLTGSGLFSLYVSSFGGYDSGYGTLGGLVVAMLWLDLTAMAVLAGAELDAELDRERRLAAVEPDVDDDWARAASALRGGAAPSCR